MVPNGESSIQNNMSSSLPSTTTNLEKKSNGKSGENKATKLILIMSFFYLLGNLPHSISPILFYFKLAPFSYNLFILLANGLIYFSHGLNILIFYYFNLEFSNELKKVLKFN